jgi:hypothetical protein
MLADTFFNVRLCDEFLVLLTLLSQSLISNLERLSFFEEIIILKLSVCVHAKNAGIN